VVTAIAASAKRHLSLPAIYFSMQTLRRRRRRGRHVVGVVFFFFFLLVSQRHLF
jgi:hypothetical protein